MAINLRHQTTAQFAVRFRARYRDASREECARMATWLLNHIEAGDFTDAQVRNVFELTVNQYSTLKSRMIALREHWLAVQQATGE